ncbi:HAMP domain-containing sensor histidine kinase [Aneurinibacillus sp. Ricciae_BoGa-3]|uniref:ATP-binding protein n=1 Tax=Aneurinibacillus sp. Ricciae_BoGa-3 TaxID=3022697 RepID=UPI00233FA2DF|nr:HAMP domain-containing sensor histidine kinase [Aneurinibacillus sp. Ricciae_BoGa-3]WCK56526.1 HAMP domain-containing sensor histidine kinase [Aneurinibacillus sp. Ricciae_BoGa-3]
MKISASFKNVKTTLQKKIIIMILGVIFFYGFLLIFYSSQLLTIMEQNEHSLHLNNEKKDNYIAIKDNILSQINVVLLYIYTGDEGNLRTLDFLKTQLKEKQTIILNETSGDERKEVDDFLSKNEDLSFLLHDQVIPVFQYGNTKDAMHMMNTQVRPLSLDLLADSKKLVANAAAKIDQENKKTVLLGHNELQYLFIMLVCTVITVIGISYYTSRRVTNPISTLLEAVRKMAEGDMGVKIQLGNIADEFTELGAAFNQMTYNIQQLMAEQKYANQRLKEETAKAKESSRIQSQFLANMSHELRTPLTVIIGFSELLIEKADDKLKNFVARILSSSEHLLTLINDLLDLAKIEAGKMELHKTVFDAYQLIDEACRNFEEAAKKKNIHIKAVTPELPLEIYGDRTKIKQVVFNLLSNALKFSEPDKPIFIQLEEKRNAFVLSVRDEGIGIPENMQKKIFNRFYQVDGGLERKYGGTGLGLPLTKELVQLHGGTITVESKIGMGSKFSVFLPLAGTGMKILE